MSNLLNSAVRRLFTWPAARNDLISRRRFYRLSADRSRHANGNGAIVPVHEQQGSMVERAGLYVRTHRQVDGTTFARGHVNGQRLFQAEFAEVVAAYDSDGPGSKVRQRDRPGYRCLQADFAYVDRSWFYEDFFPAEVSQRPGNATEVPSRDVPHPGKYGHRGHCYDCDRRKTWRPNRIHDCRRCLDGMQTYR